MRKTCLATENRECTLKFTIRFCRWILLKEIIFISYQLTILFVYILADYSIFATRKHQHFSLVFLLLPATFDSLLFFVETLTQFTLV